MVLEVYKSAVTPLPSLTEGLLYFCYIFKKILRHYKIVYYLPRH
jgi:hypothetical protein